MVPPPPHSTSSRREPSSSSSPSPKTSNPTASPSPADPSTRRLSKDSEGYPSWLPKRPPPPAPASTLGAASHIHFGGTPSPVEGYETYGEFGDDVFGRGADAFISGETEENVHPSADTEANYEFEHEYEHGLDPRRRPRGAHAEVIGGRRPTPRSVRIVSLEDSFAGPAGTSEKGKGVASREPTEQTVIGMNAEGRRGKVNAPAAARVFARGSYSMPANPTAFLPSSAQPMSPYAQGFPNALAPPQPRFHAKNLNLQILLNPSRWMKLYFWLWPLLIFYHIPLQTFFDFNAVYILIQVSKFPSSSSSRKNWALGAAAYIACWLAWIMFVCVLYELIYSFSRRWRLRRPLILPIFLSSPAFNFAAMTSYSTFSFLQHLRVSAFRRPEDAYLLGVAAGSKTGQITAGQDSDIIDPGRLDTDNAVDDGLDHELTGDFGETPADEKRGTSNANPSNANAPEAQKRKSVVRFNFNSRPNTKSAASGAQKLSGPISWRQGLAETFFFYSQNVPTVALLLPRGGLCLAVLFAFSSVSSTSSLSGLDTSSTTGHRDGTFFRADGSLTNYARGVLIANAAWTAWRILVLAVSWLGLWYFSGQRLGGLCGPRHVWDEYAQEKTRARYSAATSEYEAYRASSYGGAYAGDGDRRSDYGGDELAWTWREATRTRVQDAFEFCLMTRRMRGFSGGPGQGLRWNTPPTREESGDDEKPKERAEGFEGIEKVLAAVGFGGGPSPAKRGILSKDLFSGPPPKMGALESDSQPVAATSKGFAPLSVDTDLEIPKMAKRNSKDKDILGSGPIMSLPYPFSRPGAGQVSSKDSVPFPAAGPSGNIPHKKSGSKTSASIKTESRTGSNGSGAGSSEDVDEEEEEEEEEEEDEEEEDDDDENDDDDEEDEEDDDFEGSEEPSSGRASGSMSSLGQPISPSSRYNPFGSARRPAGAGHGRNISGVSSAFSSGTTGAGSVATHSTGNRETMESGGYIQYPIPMPPRHPAAAAGGGRGRTGQVPVAFPSVQTRPRVHSGAGVVIDPSAAYGVEHGELEAEEGDDDDDDDDDDEARGEHEDSVGLLGLPSSARNSRISLSNTSSSGHRSRSHSHQSVRSRTRTHSSSRGTPSSRSISAVRERASSLGASMRSIVHSAASASLTQLDNIMRGATGPAAGLGGFGGSASVHSGSSGSRPRSRVNSSMARLEEDVVLDLPPVYHRPVHPRDDMEAYSSSGGTHSRSGSESLSHLSAENYTFGRPMTFARVPPLPSPVREQSEAPDSPVAAAAAETEAEPPIHGGLPQSLESQSQSFYSQDAGTASPTPPGLPVSIPIPIHLSSSPADSTSAMTALSSSPLSSSDDQSRSQSSERQGVPIPWSGNTSSRRPATLVPPTPNTLALPPRNANVNPNVASTNSSGSPPDISSAAGSFVTAPATLETESATISNNSHMSLSTVGADDSYGVWGLPDARQRRISGSGGPLVDRPGQDMGAGGAGGSGWHIM